MTPHALTWKQYRRKRWLLREFIRAACMHNNNTLKPATIEKRIRTGLEIPIMFKDGNHITGLMTVQLDKESVFVTTISGKFKPGWQVQVFELLKQIAKSQSRAQIKLRGRPGWTRLLKPLGFEKSGQYLQATL